jgi:hypothetical protein
VGVADDSIDGEELDASLEPAVITAERFGDGSELEGDTEGQSSSVGVFVDGSKAGVVVRMTVGLLGYAVGEVDGSGVVSRGSVVGLKLGSLVGEFVIFGSGLGVVVGAESTLVGNSVDISMTSRPPTERGLPVDLNSRTTRSAASAGSTTARITDPDRTSNRRISEGGALVAAAMPSRIDTKSRPSTDPLRTK